MGEAASRESGSDPIDAQRTGWKPWGRGNRRTLPASGEGAKTQHVV